MVIARSDELRSAIAVRRSPDREYTNDSSATLPGARAAPTARRTGSNTPTDLSSAPICRPPRLAFYFDNHVAAGA